MRMRGNIPRRQGRLSPEKRQQMRDEREARIEDRIAARRAGPLGVADLGRIDDETRYALETATGRPLAQLVKDIRDIMSVARENAEAANAEPSRIESL